MENTYLSYNATNLCFTNLPIKQVWINVHYIVIQFTLSKKYIHVY